MSNIGELVEQYRFEVLGEAARWATVEPRQVSVLPLGQEDKEVTVIFRPPPPPLAPAGAIPFGVRCISLERRDRVAVVEGDVSVGAVHNLAARLEPVKPVGRVGRYRAHFENSGTVPVTLALSVVDSNRVLRTALAPKELTVQPARTAIGYVSLRPKEPMLRGKPVTHTFTVSYKAVGEDRSGEISGTFEQRPALGKGLVALAALTGLAAVAAGALLFLNRNNQAKAGQVAPSPIAGPPPATQIVGVTRVGADSVQVQWERSQYAASYVVQQVIKPANAVGETTEVKDPGQTILAVKGLEPGPACFQLVTVGTSGARSTPSAVKCVDVPVPPPPSTAPTSTTPTTPSSPPSSSTPSSTAPTGGTVVPTGGSTAPTPIVLKGAIAVYADKPVDDINSRSDMRKVLADLQQKAGVGPKAQLIDSRQSDRIDDGFDGKGLYVVLQDGFPTFAAALAECKAREAAAPTCYAIAP